MSLGIARVGEGRWWWLCGLRARGKDDGLVLDVWRDGAAGGTVAGGAGLLPPLLAPVEAEKEPGVEFQVAPVPTAVVA